MESSDLYWLAGLLEGEGYFGTINSRVGGKIYRYPRVGVNMTDQDIIERVAEIFKVKIFVMKPTGVSKKIGYRVTLSGERAAALMRDLRPLMGERRQARIREVLVEYDAKMPTNISRQQSCREAAADRVRDLTGRFA